MSTIFKTLGNFFTHIFPFLLTGAKKVFNDLPKAEQTTLIEQGKFGAILKQYYTAGYDAVVKSAQQYLGFAPDATESALQALGEKYGIDVSKGGVAVLDYLLAQTSTPIDDTAWDSLWTLITGYLQIIALGGAFNWQGVVTGITELVYQDVVKPWLATLDK